MLDEFFIIFHCFPLVVIVDIFVVIVIVVILVIIVIIIFPEYSQSIPRIILKYC